MNHTSFEIDEYTIHLYFSDEEQRQLLTEAERRGVPLTGVYSVLKHQPHTGGSQYHLHIYKKQNQIFAINKDGTAHDQSHEAVIPRKVSDALKQKFPDWDIPRNNLLESSTDLAAILIESLLV